MTDAKITIETEAELVMAHLHFPPSHSHAQGVACPGETEFSGLEDGLYYVSLSATGQTPKKTVKTTFATAENTNTKYRRITKYGTIGAMVPFTIENGEVL